MCKKKVAEVDDSKNIETSNYGIINLDENNLGTMGIVEIVAVIIKFYDFSEQNWSPEIAYDCTLLPAPPSGGARERVN